jgi:hypothetical protein
MEAVEKRKIPNPCRESNPRTPIVQPLTSKRLKEAVRIASF